MSLIINRENFPENKRILVTSDIHGHADRLRRVLETADFSDDDILVIVGDMIDKGPESLKTLQLIMELSEKGNVRALAGNNDMWRLLHMDYLSPESAQSFYDYLLYNRKWYGSSIFDDMARKIGMYPESPEKLPEIRDAVYERFSKEIEFIRRLPTILETQNFIFVHGGLPSNDLDDLQVRDIYGVLSLGFFHNTELSFDKFVVVGHFPVNLYNEEIWQLNPLIDTNRKIISIDGGCGVCYIGDKELEAKEAGQLNLLIIPDINCSPEKITSIYTDDLPKLTAKDEQAASVSSSHFHWGQDQRIEIINEDGEFYKVRFTAYGTEMSIPKEDIYRDREENLIARDCTDYALPVKSCESLSLLKATSQGYLVKKQGVIGWYYGEIEQ